jgi:hypothetical protein
MFKGITTTSNRGATRHMMVGGWVELKKHISMYIHTWMSFAEHINHSMITNQVLVGSHLRTSESFVGAHAHAVPAEKKEKV